MIRGLHEPKWTQKKGKHNLLFGTWSKSSGACQALSTQAFALPCSLLLASPGTVSALPSEKQLLGSYYTSQLEKDQAAPRKGQEL